MLLRLLEMGRLSSRGWRDNVQVLRKVSPTTCGLAIRIARSEKVFCRMGCFIQFHDDKFELFRSITFS